MIRRKSSPLSPFPLRVRSARRPPGGRGLRAVVHATASLTTAGLILLAPVAQAQSPMDTASAEPTPILDTEITEILHKEFDPVFIAAGLNPKDVTIVIMTHFFNAAAASNQLLFIGTDLIEKTDNPNELIGVIAHETGHAAGYHAARVGEMQKAGLVPMLLTLGLGVLAAARPSTSARSAPPVTRASRRRAPTRPRSPISRRAGSRPRGSSISSTSSATRRCSTKADATPSSTTTRCSKIVSKPCAGARRNSPTGPR
jgi:hypothetical protein